MTSSEAAKIIGCSPQQVRTLIRSKQLPAKRIECRALAKGYYYEVTRIAAIQYRDKPVTAGRPRGKTLTTNN